LTPRGAADGGRNSAEQSANLHDRDRHARLDEGPTTTSPIRATVAATERSGGDRVNRTAKLGLLILGIGMAGTAAAAEAAGPRNVVTYFDAEPARTTQAAAALRAEVRRIRAQPGAGEAMLLQEIGRPNRFAVVEAWGSEQALDRDQAARSGPGAGIAPLLLAPQDVRLGLEPPGPAAAAAAFPKGAVLVLVHVDVVPTNLSDVTAALALRDRALRAAPGVVATETRQQAGRPNHFTLVDAWRDRAAYERWIVSPPAKAFRETFGRIRGALFDERLYAMIDPGR
jgi:quinol monooxygenase YgiN